MSWKKSIFSAALGVGLTLAGVTHAEEPQTGGTLNIRINSDIRGTEGLNRDGNTDTVLHHIFETLVAYREDLTIGPLLAESWEISQDGKTYTFKIREGATYHNGDLVKAADVKWNWDRRVAAGEEWLCNPIFDGSRGLKIEAVEAPSSLGSTNPTPCFLPSLPTSSAAPGWRAPRMLVQTANGIPIWRSGPARSS